MLRRFFGIMVDFWVSRTNTIMWKEPGSRGQCGGAIHETRGRVWDVLVLEVDGKG